MSSKEPHFMVKNNLAQHFGSNFICALVLIINNIRKVLTPEVSLYSRFITTGFICFQVVANFFVMTKLYVRMHAFIHCHIKLSIGHQKENPKISDSLLATEQSLRLYFHLLNFLVAGSHLYMAF